MGAAETVSEMEALGELFERQGAGRRGLWAIRARQGKTLMTGVAKGSDRMI